MEAQLHDLQALSALSWSTEKTGVPQPISLTLPRNVGFMNPTTLPESQLQSEVQQCSTLGLSNAYSHEHSYLLSNARTLAWAKHPDLALTPDFQLRLHDTEEFCRILCALLGADLGWRLDTAGSITPQLFGRDFSEQELSEGQKILIAWSIVLHRQKDRLQNGIVMIDEPENHLHPDASIKAIKSLVDDVLGEHGQVWLATHSLPLIAWAGADSLYAIKSGSIAYAGNRVCEVVDSLAGGTEGRECLQAFLSDAEQLGFWHFVAQCLADPSVAGPDKRDPQEASLATLLKGKSQDKSNLRILDFGAGRGRLPQALARAYAGEPEILGRLEYFVYDSSKVFSDERADNARLLYDAGAKGALVDDIRNHKLDGSRVDLVLMCNVLHEIEPRLWKETFETCYEVLNPAGSLVVIEDQMISVGELPNEKGFVVLDTIEMQALFGGSHAVRELSGDVPEAYKGRISILEIPAEHLTRYSTPNKLAALRLVSERARCRVKALRAEKGKTNTQKAGRLHALYAMLWMNAELALAEG
jgi:SAM-dependent methyltransferase